MSELKVATRDNRTAYRCGEEISGAVGWKLERAPESVELRLFWHTDGKGTKDVGVEATMRFDAPQQEEARPFQFTAPTFPYSFSGKLVSVMWALELVVLPSKESTRLDLVISPTGQELELGSHEGA